MAEKIRNVRLDSEIAEQVAETEQSSIQRQILKELKEINRSTLYSSHKENITIATVSMILTGLGGLIILSATLFDWTYEDVVMKIPAGLGLAIIGIALYMGRSLFRWSPK